MSQKNEHLALRGFFRLKLGEERGGKQVVVGDSGWCKNEVMNDGFQNYICAAIGGLGGSVQVGAMVLGTGGVPGVATSALPGETRRTSCGNATVASKTMQATAVFVSGTAGGNISNVALINSTASAGSILCGNTFASSAWASNQAVSVTYQLRFGTA